MSSLRRPSLTKRIVSALSVAVFVISPITLTNNAIAAPKECDTEFYAANDIVTYDPCAVVCSTLPGGVTMEDSRDTAEAVFKFLISNPFSTNADQPMNAVQAAGFMGNMFVESGIDPATIQGHAQYNDAKARNPSVGGYALGLVQWDSGRRVQLIKYAESKGKEWSDLATQLSFLHQELETTESALLKNTSFRAVKDPGEAATIIRAIFERAGTPHDERRIKAANNAYEQFKGLAPGDVSISGTSGGRCSSPSEGNGSIAATAIELSWPTRKQNGDKQNMPAYQSALEATGVNKLGDNCSRAGISCDAFVATVLRYSKVDIEYPCCMADAQAEYMRANTDKYQEVGIITDTSQLAPGDILWRKGHIKIYLGGGREADASHCQRTASQSDETYLDDGDSPYYAFRHISAAAGATTDTTPAPNTDGATP